jgi:hypothetical protein
MLSLYAKNVIVSFLPCPSRGQMWVKSFTCEEGLGSSRLVLAAALHCKVQTLSFKFKVCIGGGSFFIFLTNPCSLPTTFN